MKKLIVILALFALFFPLVCQTEDLAEQKTETEQINPKTGFPEIQHKPFVVFNEGAAFANVTRIETQSSRNNYVWQNSMIGAFFEVQSKNMRPLNSIIRVSAFYRDVLSSPLSCRLAAGAYLPPLGAVKKLPST